MRTQKQLSRSILLTLIIVVIVSCFVVPQSINVSARSTSDCVKLTWVRSSICQQNTYYSAGVNGVMLTGVLPRDARWDGKYYRLSGYLTDTGTCTILVVQQARSCEIPATSSDTK